MNKDEVIKEIGRTLPFLKEKYHVKNLGVFGSVARGEEKQDSDIDMLVEFNSPVGFVDFIKLEHFLSDTLKQKVDLITKNALKPIIKQEIIKDKLYIKDILEAIIKIEQYTNGVKLEVFVRDNKTIDAVVRNISVIGEAVNYISVEIKSKYTQIPWREIADMRNKTIHEYFGIDLDILWKTVKEDLPTFKEQLIEILKIEGV
jgi:uncharacterized protein